MYLCFLNKRKKLLQQHKRYKNSNFLNEIKTNLFSTFMVLPDLYETRVSKRYYMEITTESSASY